MSTNMNPSQGDQPTEWRSYVDDDDDAVFEPPEVFAPKPPPPDKK
jgi:hypothetical protein